MTNYANPFAKPGALDSPPYEGGPQAPPSGVEADPYRFFLRWFSYYTTPGYQRWGPIDTLNLDPYIQELENFRSLVWKKYREAPTDVKTYVEGLLERGGTLQELLRALDIDPSLFPGWFKLTWYIPPNSQGFLNPTPEYNLSTQPATVPTWLGYPGSGQPAPQWYVDLFQSIENPIGKAQLNDAVYRLMAVWLHNFWGKAKDAPNFWDWLRSQRYDQVLSTLAQQIRTYRPRTTLEDLSSPSGASGSSPLFPGIPTYGGLPFRVVPFEYATEVQDTPLNYEFGGQVAHLLYGSPMTQDTKAAAARLMPLLEDRWKREAIWQGRGIQFWDWLEEQGWDRLLSRYNPEAVYGDWLSRSSGLTPEMRRSLSLAQDRSVDTWRNYGAGSPFGEWLSRQRQSDLAQLAGPAELGRSAGRSRWVTY